MHKFTKRTLAVATAIALMAGGGAAYAYWTVGGSGNGSAATGTNVPISAVQGSVLTPMAPGDSAQILEGTFTNTNTSAVYVATVTASISSVVLAADATGTCVPADYTLANPIMTVGVQVPTGSLQGAWSGATIKFNNKDTVNQDGCKGATVNLAYAIS